MEMEAAPGNQNGVYSERVSDEADKLLLSSTQTAASRSNFSTFSVTSPNFTCKPEQAVEVFASWLFHFSTPPSSVK